MNRLKVIFLDIDGVLNPDTNIFYKRKNNESISSNTIKLPGDKIYRLKRIVQNTGAVVVISSSWRLGFNKDTMEPSKAYKNLYKQITAYGINILGWTPFSKDRNRGLEIKWWLDNFYNKYNYYPPYIIIDDNISDIINIHRGHCVMTSSTLGLQDKHVNISVNLLNSQ